MGTNFEHHAPFTPCPTCGHHEDNVRHIGKSSGGWCFSLHVYPDGSGPKDLAEWEALYATGVIRDEYGAVLTSAEMSERIRNRSGNNLPTLPGWLSQNQAEPGPCGLVRHRIGEHCIAHGDGTWDHIVGELS